MTSIISATNINISQDNSGSWFYQIGDDSESPISSFPITIVSTNASDIIPIYVYFATNIKITNTNQFFITGSAGINFYGLRNKITIDNVSNYPGLIRNGTSGDNGYSRIYANFLRIYAVNGSTLAAGNGWIGQEYFGKGVTYNYITDCSVDAPIPASSGGIVGNFAGSANGEVNIARCYSLDIIGNYAGGICGQPDNTIGSIIIANCYSSGEIGQFAGGILAANSSGLIIIQECYSTGAISMSGGGIVGSNAGSFISVTNCYSTGIISALAGGIYGADISLISRAIKCYTSGMGINSSSGGIYANNPNDNPIGSNNYSECNNGNSGIWTTSHAMDVLNGVPTTGGRLYGNTWCQPTLESPYELSSIGLSPYTTDITTSYFQTIAQGGTSSPAILPAGYTYSILAVYEVSTDTQIPFDGKFSIDSTNGAISVDITCPIGSYLLIIRNSINPYDISEFDVDVSMICFGPGTHVLIGEPVNTIHKLQKQTDKKARLPTMNERYVDISTLRSGMLVKTIRDGYVPILTVGEKTIRTGETPLTTLYRIPTYSDRDNKSELLVTGGHSILINREVIGQIPSDTKRLFKYQRTKIDNCQRVLAMNWPGATRVPAGVVTNIYHLVLDGRRRDANYGIYVNGGWLSETTTMKYFKRFGFNRYRHQ